MAKFISLFRYEGMRVTRGSGVLRTLGVIQGW